MKTQIRKPGRPKGDTTRGVRRIPQFLVERPIFQQVRRMAVTSASARIFLQHLQPVGRK